MPEAKDIVFRHSRRIISQVSIDLGYKKVSTGLGFELLDPAAGTIYNTQFHRLDSACNTSARVVREEAPTFVIP